MGQRLVRISLVIAVSLRRDPYLFLTFNALHSSDDDFRNLLWQRFPLYRRDSVVVLVERRLLEPSPKLVAQLVKALTINRDIYIYI